MKACPDFLAPHVWLRYVDDTFAILHEYVIENFFNFLNSQNSHIQFTKELETEGRLAFLDVEILLQDDGSINTKVFRKPTHTDQYLHWESAHHLDHKRSVVRTLLNRARSHITEPAAQEEEIGHIKKVLKANGYRDWIFETPNQSDKNLRKERKDQLNTPTPSIGLPYIKGLSEELQRIFKDHGISVYHKPFNTLRSALVKPKDKQEKKDKCGVVYNVPSGTCNDFYVGETAPALGKHFEEHSSSDKESVMLEHLKKKWP